MTTRISTGDARTALADIPDGSIQCTITSPPYMGLRDYGIPDQIGLEPTLAAYVANLVAVFREVRRVLRDDGTLWLNLGDSYAGGGGYSPNSPSNVARREQGNHEDGAFGFRVSGQVRQPTGKANGGKPTDGLKPKDLMMVPARVALALQDDGWYLRSDIIWHKTAPMPESVTDRPTSAHEHIFLLTKRKTYYYDAAAIAEPVTDASIARLSQPGLPTQHGSECAHAGGKINGTMKAVGGMATRNIRNVWTLGPESFPGSHFAVMPTEIPRRCILAGTSERGQCPACGAPWTRVVERSHPNAVIREKDGSKPRNIGQQQDRPCRAFEAGHGNAKPVVVIETIGWSPSCPCDAGEPVPQTVLDPFAGAGTTLLVADRLGRHGLGVELNPEYVALAEARIRNDAPMFAEVAS